MGWVAVGLLAISVTVVAANTASPRGWGLPGRRAPRTNATYHEAAEQLRTDNRYRFFDPKDPGYKGPAPRLVLPVEVPTPLDPTRDALQSLVLSIPHVVMRDEQFLRDWAMMNFSRWVILVMYVGFVLPLFTLSYASGAIGTDRESRTLVWVMTRPIPRSAIYLGKFVGTLPWCLAFSAGGFVALCLAGGPQGREALGLYWPAALAGTVAFAALFHLIGAVFRRPVVVGLVYIFFFEALVATLPGSLKLLSVSFYVRCLMYNGAVAAGYPAEMLDVSQPVSSQTAWAVLAAATLGLTGLGMWLFARSEYRDDI
ncbi:MAG TPA: ABC transporter permease, partial [Gemmataceae bacterium]|nr:ABC transporter permease [Gemmataceae bacterium]